MTRSASFLTKRRKHHHREPAPGRFAPGGAEGSHGRLPFGILPRPRSGDPPVEEPVNGALAGFRDPPKVRSFRHPTPAFVLDQGVPRDASLTGERDLGEPEALTEHRNPAPDLDRDVRHGYSMTSSRRRVRGRAILRYEHEA